MRWITTFFGLLLAVLSIYSISSGGNFKDIPQRIQDVFKETGEFIYDLPRAIKDGEPGTAFSLPTPLIFDGSDSNTELESHEKSHAEITRANIIYFTNVNRNANSILSVTENSKLNTSAQVKAADMLAKQYFEHDSPSGVSVGDLVEDAEYAYVTVGENLARGDFKNSKEVVDAWMASPGHKENILNVRYTEIGVGIAYGKYEGDDVWLLVQHFGRPLSLCPSVNQDLKNTIELNKITLDNLKIEIDEMAKEIDESNHWSSSYEGKIEAYNILVQDYNALAKKVEADIALYNEEIAVHNACIAL
mgnify:CR=1 FL=1